MKKTVLFFSKKSRRILVSTALMEHGVHRSISKLKLVKNKFQIDIKIALLRHYKTFYTMAYYPNFVQQTIRFLCGQNQVIVLCHDCRPSIVVLKF